ncbi:hypothetical protein [Asticcacaulis benevestitus]|uniref:Uncharacterized protein n=1 Tax=Asticcacaulis benevestitus DSM 16100 = ATCC BAA-896 TaxID=1121022 RepID=V4P931_9CAUL|nr:hypothetical protein [Asticcacaulis benevestitus]ESQ90437.1 hypothetical protein ABENE_12670 [Asticcacaulis benevestitus DSM 16100 = ATCC BAA-896]
MGDFTQFLWAMWDAGQAAMIGLNPLPVLLISLVLGMIQPRRSSAFHLAFVALIPAVIVTALLPMALGYQAIWPDLSQLEVEMQLVMLFALSYVVIRAMGLIKLTLSLALPRPNGHKPV